MELRNDVNKNRLENKTNALTKFCLGFKYTTVEYIIH